MSPYTTPSPLTLGVDATTVMRAKENLASGATMFLVVSGKQTSGKDTVAPIVLNELGFVGAEHQSYATPLKAEADAIIARLRFRFGTQTYAKVDDRVLGEAAEDIGATFDIPVVQAQRLVQNLLVAVREDENLTSRHRSPATRDLLQVLGTDIRRAQDEDYWVTRALRPALDSLAHGRSVYFTDARFPNEVTNAAGLGAISLRLDVSREVQLERLRTRDGIIDPNPASLDHASETALDDYRDFTVRVLNEGPLEDVITTILSDLDRARSAGLVPAGA